MSSQENSEYEARRLRNDLGVSPDSCVDLAFVAERLSIKVLKRELGPGIEGACKSHGMNRLVVLRPDSDSPEKERFTLSHEIGHLLLHHGNIICRDEYFRSYITQSGKEHEANSFAAELLMPQKAIIHLMGSKNLMFSLFEKTARQYCTTLSASAIRLTQLYNDDALLLFHNGRQIIWKVAASGYIPRISVTSIPENSLWQRLNDTNDHIEACVEPGIWLEEEAENLVCEEETHYFKRRNNYLTILRFYEPL